MRIKEIHSSDLTASCMRYVQLRLQEKTKPVATTALVRGLVAGEAMRMMHELHRIHDEDATEPALYTPTVNMAVAATKTTLLKEGRVLSDAADAAIPEIIDEVGTMCEAYWRKFRPRFAGTTFYGCEVPVRWKYAPRMPEFASHVDLLFRDRAGRLTFVDWKCRQDAPTYHYLARNMQFGCYYASCLEGRFLLNDGLSEEWKSFGEESHGVWLHLPHLLPFGRKTRCEDDRGMEVEFSKGDERPLRMAWRIVEYAPTAADDVREELRMRVRMMRKDVFPTNPDPVGCSLCEAEAFCKRFDSVV